MKHMIVTQSALIPAPVNQVYAVIADYEVGHLAILPQPYFQSMEVLKGGQGEGTEVFTTMLVMGQTFTYHQKVTEPEKGRQITETDINTGLATSFYFEQAGNNQTEVTIRAEIALMNGFTGILQRVFNPVIIGGIFKKELQNLAVYVSQNQPLTA